MKKPDWRDLRAARIGIFLFVLALVAATLGCGVVIEYEVAIASTSGGSVSAPGVGVYSYPSGTSVSLVARPNAGYHFVESSCSTQVPLIGKAWMSELIISQFLCTGVTINLNGVLIYYLKLNLKLFPRRALMQ